MPSDLVETLPLPQRLALSYAPRASRDETLALLALDQRLAAVLRGDGEPIIAQIKLAWWRERLAEDRLAWPEGEPLLALLRQWPGDLARLSALVNGWEQLLSEQFDNHAMEQFAAGRAQAWLALASAHGADDMSGAVAAAAKHWALIDLALNLGQQSERENAFRLAEDAFLPNMQLGRRLRPLAVLSALAKRAGDRRGGSLLDGAGAALLAFRVGITGR